MFYLPCTSFIASAPCEPTPPRPSTHCPHPSLNITIPSIQPLFIRARRSQVRKPAGHMHLSCWLFLDLPWRISDHWSCDFMINISFIHSGFDSTTPLTPISANPRTPAPPLATVSRRRFPKRARLFPIWNAACPRRPRQIQGRRVDWSWVTSHFFFSRRLFFAYLPPHSLLIYWSSNNSSVLTPSRSFATNFSRQNSETSMAYSMTSVSTITRYEWTW